MPESLISLINPSVSINAIAIALKIMATPPTIITNDPAAAFALTVPFEVVLFVLFEFNDSISTCSILIGTPCDFDFLITNLSKEKKILNQHTTILNNLQEWKAEN
jgi:hypothetical protein